MTGPRSGRAGADDPQEAIKAVRKLAAIPLKSLFLNRIPSNPLILPGWRLAGPGRAVNAAKPQCLRVLAAVLQLTAHDCSVMA
jgi:hypothetical protein